TFIIIIIITGCSAFFICPLLLVFLVPWSSIIRFQHESHHLSLSLFLSFSPPPSIAHSIISSTFPPSGLGPPLPLKGLLHPRPQTHTHTHSYTDSQPVALTTYLSTTASFNPPTSLSLTYSLTHSLTHIHS